MRALLLTFLFLAASLTRAQLPVNNGDRLLALGDSITESTSTPFIRHWHHYLWSFYINRNPDKLLHPREIGRSGLQVTNTYGASADPFQLYDKRVIGLRANRIFILLTSNGGQDTNVFAQSLYSLATYRTNSATKILCGTHVRDLSDGGNALLLPRNDIHQAMAVSNGWFGVNTFRYLVGSYSNNYAAGHPYDLAWYDAEHLREGQITLTLAILVGLGEDGLVSTATINYAAGTSSAKTNCAISSLSVNGNGFSFTRLDTKLPMSWDPMPHPGPLEMMPEIITSMNRYMVYVPDAPAGVYSLFIDGEFVEHVTSATLAAGYNMTGQTNGPIWRQRVEILGCLRDQQGVDRVTLANLGTPQGQNKYVGACDTEWTAGKRDQTLIDAVADEDVLTDAYDDLIRAAAQPVARTFSFVFNRSISTPELRVGQLRGL